MTHSYPDSFDFTGFNEPSRLECDLYDLVVEGTIPAEFEGSWYRSVPDPAFPPMLGHDTYLSGDGMVSLFRFGRDGHVDYKIRYVQTERWKAEHAARRGLFGLYRNPYTDDPSVKGVERGAANTTPIWHGGRLLALKEDSRAVELDPNTLETLGRFDYGGKLRSQTMTAHTRPDPDTGDLYFFGYEASGLASRDVAYCVADRHGNLVREDWFEVPYCALMHDFQVTKDHAIFPVFPTTASLDRMKDGGVHWVWEPNRESHIGIMPRDGSVEDMRWFRGPGRMAFHFMNAFSEGNRVHLDFGCAKTNVFPFIREASNVHVEPHELAGAMVRWTFDLSRPADTWEEYVLGPGGDMPRIADKDAMRDYEIGYYATFDPRNAPQDRPPPISGPVGAGFNTLLRLEVKSGKLKSYAPGPLCTIQEHVHVASQLPGHEGWLMFVVDLHETNGSEVQIVEAANPEKGPVARVKMPMRLRCAVHGNWVPAADLPAA